MDQCLGCSGFCQKPNKSHVDIHHTPCSGSKVTSHQGTDFREQQPECTDKLKVPLYANKMIIRAGYRQLQIKEHQLLFNIKKTKILAYGLSTSWQIDREKVETVTDFTFLGSKITADGEFRHEIKRHLLLGRKAMTGLDSILKRTDITLPTKVCIVKAMIFLVVIYRCESWTIKKAENQTIVAFKLWC